MKKEIVDFLIKAKQSTYAGKGAETGPTRKESHDLAGEEALYIKEKPYWSMNYIGRVTGENFSGDFLKEALLHVPFEKPFRGPEYYSNGDYTYHCDVDGDFEWFQGRETICHNGKEIYECYFHGGLIE